MDSQLMNLKNRGLGMRDSDGPLWGSCHAVTPYPAVTIFEMSRYVTPVTLVANTLKSRGLSEQKKGFRKCHAVTVFLQSVTFSVTFARKKNVTPVTLELNHKALFEHECWVFGDGQLIAEFLSLFAIRKHDPFSKFLPHNNSSQSERTPNDQSQASIHRATQTSIE